VKILGADAENLDRLLVEEVDPGLAGGVFQLEAEDVPIRMCGGARGRRKKSYKRQVKKQCSSDK